MMTTNGKFLAGAVAIGLIAIAIAIYLRPSEFDRCYDHALKNSIERGMADDDFTRGWAASLCQ